jgi:PAS domain S-box-containing protein
MPYAEYFKAASEALIIVDRSGSIVEVNKRTEQLFTYSRGELIVSRSRSSCRIGSVKFIASIANAILRRRACVRWQPS